MPYSAGPRHHGRLSSQRSPTLVSHQYISLFLNTSQILTGKPFMMSQNPAPTPSSSKIEGIFTAALKSYEKKTKQDLTNHDLFKLLENCNSPAAILAVFQAEKFDPAQTSADDRLKRWFIPTANVLYAFSGTQGTGIGIVNINSSISDVILTSIGQIFSPAQVVFSGIGVLLLVSRFIPPCELL